MTMFIFPGMFKGNIDSKGDYLHFFYILFFVL